MKKVFVTFDEWFPVPYLLEESSDIVSDYYIPATLANTYAKAQARFSLVRQEVLDYTNKQKKKNNDNPTGS